MSSGNGKGPSLVHEVLKKTASYVWDAGIDYISEAMPVSSSVVTGMKEAASELSSSLKNTAQKIFPVRTQLKRQPVIKSIANWYLEKESEYGDTDDDLKLPFEDGSGNSEVDSSQPQSQISESERSANKISKTVLETSHKAMELNVEATSNIITSINNQGAIIQSGFNTINNTLNSILTTVTDNTSAILKAVSIGSSREEESRKRNAKNEFILSEKFDFSALKEVVKSNVMNSAESSAISQLWNMVQAAGGIKGFTSPKNLISMGISAGLNKLAPNLKENMGLVDSTLSDLLKTTMLRLGEHKNDNGVLGFISKVLGVDSTRNEVSTERSEVTAGAVPFDGITKEAITNTIPEYLRKILVAVGGKDEVYDYRNRTFRTQKDIEDEFRDKAAASGTIYENSERSRKILGRDKFGQALHDAVVDDLGKNTYNGEHRDIIKKLGNDKEYAKSYVLGLLSDFNLSEAATKRAEEWANDLSSLISNGDEGVRLGNLAIQNNVDRNARLSKYTEEADKMNVNLSYIDDNTEHDLGTIMRRVGVSMKDDSERPQSGTLSEIGAANHNGSGMISAQDYTNRALYAIFTRLEKGINVFQTGSAKKRKSPYTKIGKKLLPAPAGTSNDVASQGDAEDSSDSIVESSSETEAEKNLLLNGEDTEGNTEGLSSGERFSRWGKSKATALKNAIFSGNKDDIKGVVSGVYKDIAGVLGNSIKEGAIKLDRQFGNITGWIKHKIFGSEYIYEETDAEGNIVQKKVEKNEKGGIYGFVKSNLTEWFSGTKEKTKQWMNSVKDMFKSDDKDDTPDVKKKRHTIMSTILGSYGGSALLGGGGALLGPLGLIVGGLAGAALSLSGMGGKIKAFFFGRDKNGKPKGIFTRIGDSIVSPIRYHIGKTIETLGRSLKKNVLGPLSNLGIAIKDRITNAAESKFGKFFGTVTKILLSPFKALGKGIIGIAKAPITIFGNLARGSIKASTGAFGSIINRAAGVIAKSDEAKEDIEDRTQKWKDEDKKARDSSKYSSYKNWKEADQAKHAERMAAFNEAISEKVTDTLGAVEDLNKGQEKANESLDQITGEIIPGSSFKTHDQGIHDRLDKIIELLSGSSKGEGISGGIPGTSSDNEVTSSIVGSHKSDDHNDGAETGEIVSSGIAIASSGGLDSNKDGDVEGLIDEGAKDKPNKGKLWAKVKSLFKSNKENAKVESEKRSSLWDTVTGFFGNLGGVFGNLPGILAAVAGIWAILKNPGMLGDIINGIGGAVNTISGIVGGIGNVVGNIGNWVGDIFNQKVNTIETVLDPNTTVGGASAAGANFVLARKDITVDSGMDMFLPGSTLSHIDTDAAGNGIAHSTANHLKDMQFRQDMTYGAVGALTGNGAKSMQQFQMKATAEKQLGKAVSYADKGNDKKSEKWFNKAIETENTSNKFSNSIAGHGLTRLTSGAITTLGSQSLGGVAKGGAQLLGADEQTASTIGNITSSVSSAAMTVDIMRGSKSKIGKLSGKIVDKVADTGVGKKIIELINDGMKFLADKLNANSLFKSISSKITKFFGKITKAIGEKLAKNSGGLLAKIMAKLGISAGASAASVATLGITIAVGAVNGLASGLCSVEHLFGVMPGDADAGMNTIAGIMGTAFGALEMSPLAPVVAILDIIDIIVQPILGCGLKQGLARLLYSVFGGSDQLAAKQAKFEAERAYYKEATGKDLDTATFNDMVNTTGWGDKLWNGTALVDKETGHLKLGETGNVLTDGGVRSWFVGQDAQAARDANGNVIKDAEGNIVSKIDKYGNVIKNDMKWGDHVGNFFHNTVGSFFGGRTEYETDSNGNVKYDENGQPIVKSKTGNIFERFGKGASNFFGNIFSGGTKELSEEDKETGGLMAMAGNAVGKVASWIFNPIGSLVANIMKTDKEQDQTYVLDENGEPERDENNNMIPTSEVADYATEAMNVVNSTVSEDAKAVLQASKDLADEEYAVDSNGNRIKVKIIDPETGVEKEEYIRKGELFEYYKEGIDVLHMGIVKPMEDAIEGMNESITGTKADKEHTYFWEEQGFSSYMAYFNSLMDKTYADKVADYKKKMEEELEAAEAARKAAETESSTGGVGGAKEQTIESSSPSKSVGAFSDATSGMKRSTTATPGGNPLDDQFAITSVWGPRSDPFTGYHKGVDLISANGKSTVHVGSRFSGTITDMNASVPDSDTAVKDKNGNWNYYGNNSRGNYIEITTDDGTRKITSMHLRAGSIPASLKKGQHVNIGDELGIMGSTGWSTGAHLHYQIEDLTRASNGAAGQSVNPETDIYGIYSSGEKGSRVNVASGERYTADGVPSSAKNQFAKFRASYYGTSRSLANSNTEFGKSLRAISSLGSTMMSNLTGGLITPGGSTSSIVDSVNSAIDVLNNSDTHTTEEVNNAQSIIDEYNNMNPDNPVEYNSSGKIDYIASDTFSSATTSSPGDSVIVPDGYGTWEAWEPEMVDAGYDDSYWTSRLSHPTHGWALASYQGQLRKNAIATNRYKGQDIYGIPNAATIDDRLLVATNHNIGNKLPVVSGDYVDIEMSDGTVWKAMIADAKSDDSLYADPEWKTKYSMNEWGHNDGKNTVELIYHSDPRGVDSEGGNRYKKVKKITKTGTYDPNKKPVENPEDKKSKNTDANVGGEALSSIGYNGFSSRPTKSKQAVNVTSSIHPVSGTSHGSNNTKSEPDKSSSQNNGPIITILYQLLKELKSISTNTGESNTLLEDLNNKEFVDQGLRDSLNSVKSRRNNTKDKPSYHPTRTSSNIIAMARP